MSHALQRLIAVDVGNSAVKLGLFQSVRKGGARPLESIDWAGRVELDRSRFLDINDLEKTTRELPAGPLCWVVASVNGRVESGLSTWVARYRPQDRFSLGLSQSGDRGLEQRSVHSDR